jgi:predicted amidohydrolase
MKRRKTLAAATAAALALGLASACAPPVASPRAFDVVQHGSDRGAGNVLALEMYAEPAAYASQARMESRVVGMLEAAKADGLLRDDTIVVLPEYAGAWLVAMNEPAAAYTAETTTDAMTWVVLNNLPAFLEEQGRAPSEDKDRYAIFALKAERVAAAYQSVFGSLAARYAVTLVAGSVLLPGPFIEDGRIGITPGAELINTTFVFGPDGELAGPPVKKVFPTSDEQGFLGRGTAEELPIFDTPAGRLGVLICADAWYPETVRAMGEQGAEIVVVPQYVTGKGLWNAPWKGYSGHAAPDDVDPDDVGELSEGEAWRKYALGRITATGATTVAIVPLRGELWDLGTDGEGLSFSAEQSFETPEDNTARVVSIWR